MSANNKGLTPLHCAASKGQTKICQLIMEHLEEKNPKDDIGRTPIEFAIIRNFSSTVDYLKSVVKINYCMNVQ